MRRGPAIENLPVERQAQATALKDLAVRLAGVALERGPYLESNYGFLINLTRSLGRVVAIPLPPAPNEQRLLDALERSQSGQVRDLPVSATPH